MIWNRFTICAFCGRRLFILNSLTLLQKSDPVWLFRAGNVHWADPEMSLHCREMPTRIWMTNEKKQVHKRTGCAIYGKFRDVQNSAEKLKKETKRLWISVLIFDKLVLMGS